MLSVRNLQVAYGSVQALWDVSFDVPEGEIVAIIGANGAGKSTTLKTLAGLLKPMAGTISLDGETLDRASSMEIVRHGIVLVPEGRRLFPDMSVLDNLLMGAYSTPKAGREERLEKVFSTFPSAKERQRQLAGTLSGGEQQMVAIGRGLMADPRILMLDEPSLGLAPRVVEEVFRIVRRDQRQRRHGPAGRAEHPAHPEDRASRLCRRSRSHGAFWKRPGAARQRRSASRVSGPVANNIEGFASGRNDLDPVAPPARRTNSTATCNVRQRCTPSRQRAVQPSL